jgi:hypothetical protein
MDWIKVNIEGWGRLPSYDELPRGGIVGAVDVVGCVTDVGCWRATTGQTECTPPWCMLRCPCQLSGGF